MQKPEIKELKNWLKENFFRTDGALNAKKCRAEWFEKYGHPNKLKKNKKSHFFFSI